MLKQIVLVADLYPEFTKLESGTDFSRLSLNKFGFSQSVSVYGFTCEHTELSFR